MQCWILASKSSTSERHEKEHTKKQYNYDLLLSVILMCKETEQTTNTFVHLVNAATYPMIL